MKQKRAQDTSLKRFLPIMTNKVDFDEYTENYNDLLAKDTQFFSDDEAYFADYKVSVVRQQRTTSTSRILEYGCGIGRNFPALGKQFPDAELVGTDISEASLEFAVKHNPSVKFVLEQGDLTSLGKFDLIFVAGVFHHIPPAERQKAANLLHQRLAPGGELFVFEHNPYNPVTRHIVNNCPYDEDAIILKPKELKFLLSEAGLQVTKYAYCLFIPPKFKKLVALERYLEKVPLGGQYWVGCRRRPL